MPYASWTKAVEAGANADQLAAYAVDRLGRFADGEHVLIDFLDRAAVGQFCRALGFSRRRNWAALTLDVIAPPDRSGANVVPAKEAAAVLALLRTLIRGKHVQPLDEAGKPKPVLINDFLPKGTFQREPTLGHLWEWQYALAVELEHGRTRGTNVTNNHPLTTALVVLAHLSEDRLYYARLWVMETEGELFAAQLDKKPFAEIHETLDMLSRAQTHLAQRIAEKLAG
ncbi:MAG: DUF5661 family protein [Candidatus Lutibacillus vidarii]|nr:hypothetical protein [Candidatus Lutibacillus vidarii]